MRTRIVRIGNSQGVRIPKPLIEQAGVEGEVELRVVGRSIVIVPANEPRRGWADAFNQMAGNEDDELLDGLVPTSYDDVEWEW